MLCLALPALYIFFDAAVFNYKSVVMVLMHSFIVEITEITDFF